MSPLQKLKNLILDVLFPPLCLSCGKNLSKNENSLCQPCLATIPTNKTLFCGVCKSRLPENKKVCHKNAPYILGAASDYNNRAVKKLVWHLKYRNQKSVAGVLAKILLDYLEILHLPIKNPLLVAMPLHPKKEKSRGYNQAGLITNILAKNFNWGIDASLRRIKNTKPQAASKSRREREENIASCFSFFLPAENKLMEVRLPSITKLIGPVCPLTPLPGIAGKTIFLVDDVSTSGATLNEAAVALKAAGAKKIIGLVVAKA